MKIKIESEYLHRFTHEILDFTLCKSWGDTLYINEQLKINKSLLFVQYYNVGVYNDRC